MPPERPTRTERDSMGEMEVPADAYLLACKFLAFRRPSQASNAFDALLNDWSIA